MNDRSTDARDYAGELIEWLSDTDLDVWFGVTEQLNWDSSGSILEWLTERQDCDRANIALIVSLMNPDEYVAAYDESEPDAFQDEPFAPLFLKILENWKSGFYTRSELALGVEHVGELREIYESEVAARSDGTDPFDLPPELLRPIVGRPPSIPESLRVENNETLRELLTGLGS